MVRTKAAGSGEECAHTEGPTETLPTSGSLVAHHKKNNNLQAASPLRKLHQILPHNQSTTLDS